MAQAIWAIFFFETQLGRISEMKSLVFFVLIFFYTSTALAGLRFGLGASFYSTSIAGVNELNSIDQKIKSHSSLGTEINLSFSLSKRLQLLIDYADGEVEFDDSEINFSGEPKFSYTNGSVGFRYIFHPRVAFRFYMNSIEDVAFNFEDNEIDLYKERINFLSVYYDQIVFMGRGMYSGFKLGYDVSADGVNTIGRNGHHIMPFMVIYGFTVEYKISEYTKSNEDLDFEQSDRLLTMKYMFSF